MSVLTEKQWVSFSAVSTVTGLRTDEVRKLVEAGEFTTLTLAGRRTKIDMASVDAYLERSVNHAKAATAYANA